jgi:tetratricopeptide (TPR) repeat protein
MKRWENAMRVSFLALGAGLILASLPTASNARADHDIFPHSLELMAQGVSAQKASELNKAIDYFEAALVADPRNRGAMIALAQIARVQGLPGKAIGLYREALVLEPNDVAALAGQGEALVDKGAIDKAKERLSDAKRLCAAPCGEIVGLEKALSANALKQMATAEPAAVTPAAASSTLSQN